MAKQVPGPRGPGLIGGQLRRLGEPATADILSEETEFGVSKDGAYATRVFHVGGLKGSGPSLTVNALLAPNIPRYGESFPRIDLLRVTNIHVKHLPKSPTQAWVTVRYGYPDPTQNWFDNEPGDDVRPKLEVVSTVTSMRTDMDRFGTAIVIDNYTALENNELVVQKAQGGEVDIQIPLATFRYHRRELPVDSRGRGLFAKAEKYVGMVNHAVYLGKPEAVWLCTHLGGPSDDGENTFNVTYEFQRAPRRRFAGLGMQDTWDAVAWYIDPATGRPGEFVGRDPRSGDPSQNGIKKAEVMERADFSLLDLHL